MPPEHLDVLIIGAGLSGIGAAWHLQTLCPGKTFTILEDRQAIGGTWDLFRYPGIRSDSDMYTLGYHFRPWRDAKSIADGPSILRYIQDTAREFGIDRKIRFGHRVTGASWSSEDARWTVEVEADGERRLFSCGFLYTCTGYYDYESGYTPVFPGAERFKGPIIHPQHWPEDLDYKGKRVVVIGSGATAITLVPAMARDAGHVIMLQRSPSYVLNLPGRDPIARGLKKVLPERMAYRAIRTKNVLLGMLFFNLARKRPQFTKRLLMKGVQKELGPDFDVGTHFNPRYKPWDERLCVVPDADLFKAIREGRASVVTDQIESFTETGIQLRSGQHLDADIIITATGLKLKLLSGMKLVVDGQPVDLSKTLSYKGMMYSGIPNLASAFGYTNASWTLKCDLGAAYVCRLLNHMDEHGYVACMPRVDPSVEEEPLLDFTSGYVQRALETLPRQGSRTPWKLHQNYLKDMLLFRYSEIDDGVLEFQPGQQRRAAES